MTIRTVRPADAGAYRNVLARTSDEDRYYRFFHTVDTVAPEEIRRFVSADPSVVAFIAEDGERPLGVAQAFVTADRAELGIVVAADARHHGVGAALIGRLVAALRARSCSRLTAYSLAANAAFATLARSVGMTPRRLDGSTIEWTLDVRPLRRLDATA